MVVNRLRLAALRIVRVVALIAAAAVLVGTSGRITVRLPLAVLLALIGLVLALATALAHRPPARRGGRGQASAKPAPALPARRLAADTAAWAFDDVETGEEW